MKFFPEFTFQNRSPLIAEKEIELALRRDKIKNLPVFDIKKISETTIRQCVDLMYSPEDAEYYLNTPEDFEYIVQPWIYLAWLWANDFMVTDGITAYEKEGFPINYDYYEREEGGFNLLYTIQNYGMDRIVHLLKGL